MKSYQFKETPVGLPDCQLLSGGKFSLTGFSKTLGMDRAKLGKAKKAVQSLKGETSSVCPKSNPNHVIVNFYSTPWFRLFTLKKVVNSGKDTYHDGNLYSWDKAVIEQYMPDFFRFASAPTPIPSLNKFEPPTDSCAASLIKVPDFSRNSGLDDGDRKHLDELEAVLSKLQLRIPALIEQLNEDVENWAELDDERRSLAAMVVWSVGTVFNLSTLNEALEENPQIFVPYYEKMISKLDPGTYTEIEIETPEEKRQSVADSISDLDLEVMSVPSLCEEMISAANSLKASPKDKALSRRILALATSISLRQKTKAVLSQEEFDEFTKRVIEVLSFLYPPSPMARHFSGEDGATLAIDWVIWSACGGLDLTPKTVVDSLRAVVVDAEPSIERVVELEDELSKLTEKLEELGAKEEPSNIRDKRDHKNAIAAATSEKVALEAQLSDLALDIYELCYPDLGDMSKEDKALTATAYPRERGLEIMALLPEFVPDGSGDGQEAEPEGELTPPSEDAERALERETFVTKETQESSPANSDTATPDQAETREPVPVPEPELERVAEEELGSEQEIVKEEVKQVTTRAHTVIGQECLDALEQDAFIPGEKINDLFNESLVLQQVNYAAQLSYSLEETQLSTDFLPWHLFKAAYYGVNTFDDRAVFSKSQRTLNGITPADIESWSKQRGGEMLPYLVFAAAFQPTVFGGTESTGHLLLASLPETMFDKNTASLISETAEMARRGEKMTLSLLRQAKAGAAQEAQKFETGQVEEWCKKIVTATRGYAPYRKAQSLSLESGLFGRVTDALILNKREEYTFIEQFVGQYQTPEDAQRLLVELLQHVNMYQGEDITKIGMTRFFAKMSALTSMCREWLAVNRPVHSDKSEEYAKKFITRLENTITFFAEGSKAASSAGAAAGMGFLAATLSSLLRVINREVPRLPYDMVKGWYYHPRQKMFLETGHRSDETSEAVRWMIGNVGVQVETRHAYESALAAGRVHMAEVIRQRLELGGVSIDGAATKRAFESEKKKLLNRCINLESMVETAAHSGLLSEQGPQNFITQLEEARDEIESFDTIRPMDDVEAEIDSVDRKLRAKTASLKEKLENRYIEGVEKLRSQVADAVPDSWVESIERALSEDNLPVVQEMLADLDRHIERGERMRAPDIKELPVLSQFITKQPGIFRFMQGKGLRRDVLTEANEGGAKMGLSITKATQLKRPLQVMDELLGKKPAAKLNQTLFEQMAGILAAVGIAPTEATYNAKVQNSIKHDTAHGTSFTYLQLKAQESRRPFPYFGPRRDGQYWTVIIAYQNWTVDNLREQLQNRSTSAGNCILISVTPITPEHRDEFARYCKDAQRTIFLIDPVSLVFLASVDNDELGTTDTEKFLWQAAPYTYYNPYVGKTASPPEPEMLFGREHEITSLLDMRSGAAIVYGGRQLGKSTILEAVQRAYHNPRQHHYAYYSPLDRELCRDDPQRKESLDLAKREVWGRLYDFMLIDGLIADPVKERTSELLEKAVTDTITSRKDVHIIALFDEIDPILKIDFAHDFPIFRAIRSLMRGQGVQGRFKMIIGGLANVKRFEDSPNYPLSQLGSSIQVSIMPSREATHLVVEPIQAAGYRFESTDVVNAILASTNRHPGLIQILCNQLLISMGRNANGAVGQTIITRENVQSALNVPEVLDTIRERFEMTLNLDKRYLVMVYSILNEGTGAQSFSVAEAKDLATIWAPKTFGSYSERQFKHFLNELVGLGVMLELESGRFELRNSSVRKLLSESRTLDVQNKLEQAIIDMDQIDPMDYRSFSRSDAKSYPRPITFRDEKTITGMVSEIDSQKRGFIQPKHFTSTMVVGSDAQGIKDVALTMPSLFETEQAFFKDGASHKAYQMFSVSSAKYKSPADLDKNMGVLFANAEKKPQMLVIDVAEDVGIALLLGLLDTSNSIGSAQKASKYPVRIIFLVGPVVYWEWLQAAEFTAGREDAQAVIHLARWKRCAINLLLEQIDMVDSAPAVEEAAISTGGWHCALNTVVTLRRSKKNATSIRDFGRNFQPLPETDERNSRSFLKMAGVFSLPWVEPLLVQLSQDGSGFDRDGFGINLICVDSLADTPESEIDGYLKWLLSMDLLKAESMQGQQRKLVYSVAPEIKHMVEMVHGSTASVD
ncbi:hypothetical protein NCG89_02980 [Spongiibacter taiwanensis]|uniref:hypothetical protein n=1 Tax=Spongiibacter taiwanensis TaxID=1748242 RepID=UPI002035F8DE|nr:hypothetical protein [Spongiibacter taiwanensis]USA43759.1 hypothetical protein NCG89_02980 [Spongiibacter taiwanensis]